MKRGRLSRGTLVGVLGLTSLVATLALQHATIFGAVEMPASSYIKGLSWLGHASFKWVRAGVTIYFDPWQLQGEPHDADFIFVSHPHFDHLSPADVAKVAKEGTVIVAPAGCQAKLEHAKVPGAIREVKPGDRLDLKGVKVEAVPAYNTNKTFHLRDNQWVGFIVEVDATRVYHAGDTDFIPEMNGIQADVALLPVSGTYVMTAEEAAQAAQGILAKVYIPMHYGAIVGTLADAQRFQRLSSGKIVELLGKGP